MSIRIEYRTGVQASAERIWEIIARLDEWAGWNPIYPEASGTIGFGGQLSLLETLPKQPQRRITAKVLDWTPGAQLILRVEQGFMTYRLQYIEIDRLADASSILAVGASLRGWFPDIAQARIGRSLKLGFGLMGEAIREKAERSQD